MFARTERLTLRPPWPEDAPALLAAIGHAEVARMLARVPWPYGAEDAAANDWALANGARLVSVYETTGGKVWLITEADRSATTALLPSEY